MSFKDYSNSGRAAAAANQNIKEKEYWLDKLSGEWVKSIFPYDHKKNVKDISPELSQLENVTFKLTGELFSNLIKISKGVDPTLHIILTSALVVLLYKYTFEGKQDIFVGTPIYRQKIEGEFINTVLTLRNKVAKDMAFKELLVQVRQSVVEAVENQDYPVGILLEQLNLSAAEDEFPLFDIAILLENIHDREYIRHTRPNMIFSFLKTGECIEGVLEYNPLLYRRGTIERIAGHYVQLLRPVLDNLDIKIARIDILVEEEKKKLLVDFNGTNAGYPEDETIHGLFERQAEKTPGSIALVDTDRHEVTYGELNEKAGRLAGVLRRNGIGAEAVVGIMMEPSLEMVVSLIAILKAGAAYLPIDPHLPKERILYMLADANAKILLTTAETRQNQKISYTSLSSLNPEGPRDIQMVVTRPRGHIKAFDQLPMPDRSLINQENYRNKIGMASVEDCISLQATRGCPYKCLFCHKVWSKHHVYRSAENLYDEVEYYYKRGMVNFAFIDDCFNLDRENSARFFRLVIENKLKIQFFFPNGLRGDIMTPDDVDLMVEAGCRGINLSLETASPRLQKLIKKNLDIDKFKNIMDYIAAKHPGVILEIATMHGFPTETEEEAVMTLDFIKSIQWIHFPYIHILKIYPNTEMEALALEHGVSKRDILASRDLAYHELPGTLPFPKSFTRKYQADFMNRYFLSKDRLRKVLPVQMEIMSDKAIIDKYNAYLPADIGSIEDIFEFTGIDGVGPVKSFCGGPHQRGSFFKKRPPAAEGIKRILFLDLSQHFSSHSMLYNVSEQPLGLIYLLTYLKQELGGRIDGKIYKAGVDFDSYEELKKLVDDYKPGLVGIRSLTFYKEFFHETVSLLRQWGLEVPIIAGGPYATSDYETVLQDRQVDLVVFGEGEYTLAELVKKMLDNNFKLPVKETLQEIDGIAFIKNRPPTSKFCSIILPEHHRYNEVSQKFCGGPGGGFSKEPPGRRRQSNLAYVMYTSGSTGKPKGVMVEHRQVNNCISWMQGKFNLSKNDVIVQRTNLTFDPSVWEIFWPLVIGASVYVPTTFQRKDAEFLIRLMAENEDLTMMYCPSTLVKIMVDLVKARPVERRPVLKLPWLIIGAEPISRETIADFYSFYEGKIVNTYGPTEGTINNTYFDVEREDVRSVVPIGKPVANNRIYILSRDLQLMPLGIAGELCISGAGLARGYINNIELTAEKFCLRRPGGFLLKKPPPWTPRKNFCKRLYKTGDLARWLEDGNIEFLGRVDEQVKLRGYRIELGEIEGALLEHDAVDECVVVIRNSGDWREEVNVCKSCGIDTNYPGVNINDDGNCEICENLSSYKNDIDAYFKRLMDLKDLIKEESRGKKGKYDCLLLYSGGRGSAYALYQLVEMGFIVLAVTYDNGYFGKSDLKNIEKITAALGVDHIVLTHGNSEKILKESMKTADTVCRGCFHTSSSLAAEYAFKNDIPVVVGATLSRGQIIENKLFMFIRQGITNVKELEKEIANLRKAAAGIDKTIFDYIGIDLVKEDPLDEKVKFVDFYRYCDITNEEMIDYLDNKDPYWKTRKNYAIYSTNCPIKQLGDYSHSKQQGYHYYGSATSWEKRLKHITLENLKDDLHFGVTEKGYRNFLKRLGLPLEESKEGVDNTLVAYVVPAEGHEIAVSALRDYLSERLPGYMIPAYFEPVEGIPLTANGKVDKRALPKPAGKTGSSAEYCKPGNEAEEKLAAVWQEVLGGGNIGTNDNFFALGGDSIKAIQITANLQQYGLKLEIRDLFLNPTIKQLGKHIKPLDRMSDQGIAVGDVPLTPIQCWFFRHHFSDAHHFNQSLMLYREKGFDEKIVRKVFAKIVEHHDALRMRFDVKGDTVVQENRAVEGEENLFHLEIIDFKDKREAANRVQRGLDLSKGPLVKLGLFKTAEGDHLLIVIHHLVMDGISWRILLEDIAAGYRQAESGEAVEFPAKSDSFQYWSRKLKEYAGSDRALQELVYWKGIEKTAAETGLRRLPTDHNAAKDKKKKKYCDTLSMRLDRRETEKLSKGVHRAFNTEINDILLTALGLGLKEWAGLEKTLITLEGHGREPIIEGVNIGRTIGWYTTQFPVILDMGKADDLSYEIKFIKETLRAVPNKGIGYGILKYLTPGDKNEGLGGGGGIQPQILFNYLGQFGRDNREGDDGGGDRVFRVSPLQRGDDISLESEAPYTLSFDGMIAGGEFILTFTYNRYQYEKGTVQRLVESCRSGLLKVIDHCMEKEEGELTPADLVEDEELSLEELAEINKSIDSKQIEKIYSLSPMQEGMLFHFLMNRESHAYFELGVFNLKGKIDPSLLEKSFNVLVERYDILRTVFRYEKVKRPLQIIFKRRDFKLHFQDVSHRHMNGAETSAYLEEFKSKEQEKGFDLTRDLLMRCSLLKTGEDSYTLVWSFHHILMDGWCLGIIYRDLTAVYRSLESGESPAPAPAAPYSNYIRWLKKRDKKQGLAYWREYLEGYEHAAGLASFGGPADGDAYRPGSFKLELNETLTGGLNRLAGDNQVTVNTVFQTLWGILLQRYNNSGDVVYGAVVSGRPSEIAGIEGMVGLFINTLPVRVRSGEGTTVPRLLRDVGERALASQAHQYLPLAEIQENSPLKNKLIDHIVIFENLPIQDRGQEAGNGNHAPGFTVENHQFYEQSNYSLDVVVVTGSGTCFQVKFNYNASVYTPDFIKDLAAHFEETARQVVENPGMDTREINLILEKESEFITLKKANMNVDFNI